MELRAPRVPSMLRDAATENVALKIVSVVISVLLFSAVRGSGNVQRSIDVPATFISGRSDWGIRQSPGALERMQKTACTNMKEIHLVEGAGHSLYDPGVRDAVMKAIADIASDLSRPSQPYTKPSS